MCKGLLAEGNFFRNYAKGSACEICGSYFSLGPGIGLLSCLRQDLYLALQKGSFGVPSQVPQARSRVEGFGRFKPGVWTVRVTFSF